MVNPSRVQLRRRAPKCSQIATLRLQLDVTARKWSSLMLLVVRAPPAAAIRSIATTESTVLSEVVLVATGTLMPQSTKAAVLVSLTKMAWVATETLLLREASLATLALRVVGRRSWASRLSSKSGRTRSTTLAIAEGLQRVLIRTLLTELLLTVRGLATIAALRLSI